MFQKEKDDTKVKHKEDEIASETISMIFEETKGLDAENGGFNAGHMWNLKKKILPKAVNAPTAMRDSRGKLFTSKKDISNSSMEYYQDVLRNRDIKKGLEEHKDEIEY